MAILFAEDKVSNRSSRRTVGGGGARPCLRLALLVFALSGSGCGAQPAPSQVALNPATPSPGPTPPAGAEAVGEEVRVADAFVAGDELAYEGYTVRRRYKTVRLDYPPEMKSPPLRVQVSYVVLQRKGRAVATFDAGMYFGAGNSTSFGLFPFLGADTKQLVVSQDVFRGGRQWVVSLSPRFRVIFDGPGFGVGREGDDMGVVDLDGDGVYEITAPLTDFYGFDDWALAPMQTPLPTVIFKYDAKAGKYLPANERFRDHLLRDVAEARGKVRGPEEPSRHLEDVLEIVLSYIFAGSEREAWDFYDAAYRLPDKAKVRREVEATLKAQPVYRFMYRKGRRA